MGPELLTTAEMSKADRLAIEAGAPGIDLMEAAGNAVANAVRVQFPDAKSVLIAVGPGNNGGDGYVAARVLAAEGYEVALSALSPPEMLKGDAAKAAAGWTGKIVPLSEATPGTHDLVVDALFGAGLTRPLAGDAADFIERVAGANVPVLAVDVPSGVDGTTGEALGPVAAAQVTVTFFRAKPGHYLYPGRELRGRLFVEDIGISAAVLKTVISRTAVNGPDVWKEHFPWPIAGGHKYSRGHVALLSGAAHRTGAARLAARGALRIGAGLVTVLSAREALAANAAQLTAIMLSPCDTAEEIAEFLADSRHNACVVGPGAGVGDETRARVMAALKSEACVVLDADALTSFEAEAEGLFIAIGSRAAPTVITPHGGEFARLFPDLTEISKLAGARAAAERSGAVVVLKGADTVVAAPDVRAAINANAEPWLATAGAGDVLAGLVAGLLAQGMPAFEAACAAVWLHGDAGRGPGLIAEDIPEALPGVLARLQVLRKEDR